MSRLRLFIAAAAVCLTPLPALAQPKPPGPPPGPPPCADAQHHQFDFWVGAWDVYPTGKDRLVSHSLIESVYGGCGVRENWNPVVPNQAGGSLSAYVAGRDIWRQTWIDSSGAWVDFEGGWNGQAMVLTGPWRGAVKPGEDALVRMTYTQGADGSVRQFGEASQDGGKTWAPNFDFTYRKSKG